MTKETTMRISIAAAQLDAIRNDRESSTEERIARVDRIGEWLASQKNGTAASRLLTEAHRLRDRLAGGTGKGGVRIDLADRGDWECPSCGESDCPGCQPHPQTLSCFI